MFLGKASETYTIFVFLPKPYRQMNSIHSLRQRGAFYLTFILLPEVSLLVRVYKNLQHVYLFKFN